MKSITVQNQLSLGFRPVCAEPRVGLLLTGNHFFVEVIYRHKIDHTYLYYENFVEALLARRVIGSGLPVNAAQDLTVEFTLQNKSYEFEIYKGRVDDITLRVDRDYFKESNGSLSRIRLGNSIASLKNLTIEVDNVIHSQDSYSYCLFFDSMVVFLPFYFIPYIEDAIKKTKPIFATDCQTGQFFIPKQSLEQTIAYIKRNFSQS